MDCSRILKCLRVHLHYKIKKSFLTQCSKCNQLICISHFAPNLHECDKMAKKEEDPKYYLKKHLQSAIPSKIDKI